MSGLSRERWQVVSPYLDRALELAGDERTAWLASLSAEDPRLAADVQALLEEQSALSKEGFLEGGTPPLPSQAVRERKPTDRMRSDQLGRLRAALAGRYAIERELGRGGMATVYLADDVKHHRKVAVKVLRPELAFTLGPDRFLREVAIAARLNHPHILALYDSGESGGFLFYVMPYIRGESLRHKLAREKQLSIDEALRITGQVASALDHAHEREVIHRDVKPENILLYEGEAVVADFGIALAVSAAADERLTKTGLVVGTPEYMSPEQAAGEREVDGRSDVYSLGCLLYETLAGEPPYTGPTAQVVIAKRLADPVPSIRRLRAAVPPAVEHALLKALARHPADRFASAGAFVEALTAPAPTSAKPPSVAVLPFLNLSPDPENEYFADGITEDVIAQLSKVRALHVISRTSVMPFKKREQGLREIAAQLAVATLLEGSVRRVGDRVRIVAQLINADTDQHLWAETYDRRLTDIFAIQSDVALQIVAALKAELSPDEKTRIRRESTSNLQAYQLYLQGRYCYSRYTEEWMRKGIEYFEQAIVHDPDYALAYAGIAFAYVHLGIDPGGGAVRPQVAYARAREAVTKALALDGGLGEAHAVLALLKLVCDFDWVGAEAEFKAALELNPGSADTHDHYGWLCAALERYDEALALVTRARELDPLAHGSDVANVLMRAGRNEEARDEALRTTAFDPRSPRAHSTLGWAHLKLGDVDRGLAELEKAVALDPGSTLFLAQLGQGFGMVGKVMEAREVLRQLQELSRQRYVSPYHLAYVYTGLGELETALDRLEEALAERAGGVYGIKGSFLFTRLRPHPRFMALLKKMNLA
jgi:serine/threonine protein kinase/Tfp pilus assembly protein PilF